MMSNMSDSYMNNGSLSPPMPRTVSSSFFKKNQLSLSFYIISKGSIIKINLRTDMPISADIFRLYYILLDVFLFVHYYI